jgi:hypothetical protein
LLTVASSQAFAQTAEMPTPHFTTDPAILFEGNSGHDPVLVQSGDIALRKDDASAALGTYPVPKDFRKDLADPSSANWSYYQYAFKEPFKEISDKTHLRMLGLSGFDRSEKTQVRILKISLKIDELTELNPKQQEGIPEDLKFTASEFNHSMRGNFKPIHLDEFEDNSVAAEKHKLLPLFKPNFYDYDLVSYLKNNDEDTLKHLSHYYPGTPFVSHAGIISVEIEADGPHIYIYEAYPSIDADPKAGIVAVAGGLFKRTPEEFWGPANSDYGVVVRPTEGDEQSHVNAVAAAWKHYADFKANSPNVDHFDEQLNWRQDKTFYCSSFVWRAYVEGAHQNLISDFNMTLLPAWALRMSGEDYHNNLIIAPQSLLLSNKTKRIVDFESKFFEPAFVSLSAKDSPKALALPSDTSFNSVTGHPYFSIGEP